jgi:hypothetical protein
MLPMDELESHEHKLIREVSYNLSRSSGWMKFLGVMMIVYGILIALSIVGIIFAWLPVWMGVLLYRAASLSKRATRAGEKLVLEKALQYVNNFFAISGILFIVTLVLTILAVIVAKLTGVLYQMMELFST